MITNTYPSEKQGKAIQKDVRLKVLLAYDGSQHAKAALSLLQDIPLADESLVNILAVMPTQQIGAHERLNQELREIKERLGSFGIDTLTELKAGNPAASINDTASLIQTDLTIMGAKGLRATLGILLGGVAQQVVEYSCCPVLVVRAPYNGLKRVLLVTDGSQYSRKAVQYLTGSRERARFPLPEDASLTVMHVLPPPISEEMIARSWTVGPEVMFPIPVQTLDKETVEKREEQEGKDILDDALDQLHSAGIQAKSQMPRGDAATEVIEYVRQEKIDLVICGSRGLSQVTSWLLGSVSRKLVHYAGCSVLVVK